MNNITTTINSDVPVGGHQRSQWLIGLATNILTWTNLNPSTDKYLHPLKSVGRNYLSIPKLHRLHHWSLGMDKWFNRKPYWACGYLPMFIYVSKRSRDQVKQITNLYMIRSRQFQVRLNLIKHLLKFTDGKIELSLWALSQYEDGPSRYGDFHYKNRTVVTRSHRSIGNLIPILVRRHLWNIQTGPVTI